MMSREVEKAEKEIGSDVKHVTVEMLVKARGAMLAVDEDEAQQFAREFVAASVNDDYKIQGAGTIMDFDTFVDELKKIHDANETETFEAMLQGRVFGDTQMSVFLPKMA